LKKIKIKNILFIGFIVWCWLTVFIEDSEHNKFRCETKKIKINGIIDFVNSKANYTTVHINTIEKAISLNIKETKVSDGFENGKKNSNR
jgi:hypothetical protein